MTPSLLALALLAAATPPGPTGTGTTATARPPGGPAEAPTEASGQTPGTKDGLHRFRMPFEDLVDETIGSTSRPVRFDWRKSTLQLAVFAAQPAELNNFNTVRAGALVRYPTDSVMLEFGLAYAWVFGTESSRQLSLTPYRQPGRPPRMELNFSVGIPLAEGVVTAWPSWFPAVELVFSAYFDFRYLFYPNGYSDVPLRTALVGIFSPQLSDEEIESLDGARLPGMGVDNQRYYLLGGFGVDVYFASGFFLSPRLLMTIPLIAAVTDSEMVFGYDFSLAVGYAF